MLRRFLFESWLGGWLLALFERCTRLAIVPLESIDGGG
jgi:hypothetical protein